MHGNYSENDDLRVLHEKLATNNLILPLRTENCPDLARASLFGHLNSLNVRDTEILLWMGYLYLWKPEVLKKQRRIGKIMGVKTEQSED